MKIRLIKLRRKTSSIKAWHALENNGSHSRNPFAGRLWTRWSGQDFTINRHRGQWYNLQAGSKGSGKEGLREEKRGEEEDRRGDSRQEGVTHKQAKLKSRIV